MAITVKHKFVSAIPDAGDTTIVQPSNWNDDHDLVGTIPVANGGTGASTATDGLNNLLPSQTGNNGKVLATDGTNATWTTNGSGDVVGPASSTDNAIARFDTTTGKLIQNSVVTIGDTGAATGFTTLSASTSVTTPIVQASNSGGLALKNSGGTTQMSVGAGGGDNMSINVSTNLNGTNAQIDISPTGTGHVHINPTGVNSIQINPTYVGTMDNMTIGATTPKNGSFVDLSVTGTTSFDGSQGTVGQVLTSAGTGATPTWTTPTTGTVTSVGLSAPAMFTVSNSPVTNSGTLALTYSGTALPLANGGTGATGATQAMAQLMGFTSTATAAGTTTLTNTSSYYQLFTGTQAQTITLPVTSTLQTGWTFHICNNSTGTLTVNSSGGNSILNIPVGLTVMYTCIGTTLTTAADWESGYTDFSSRTGNGSVVLNDSPQITGGMNFVGTNTSNSVFGTSVTSGTLIFGGTAGTGTITFGQSTVSQTTNIQAGATASGSTKTMNIGTGGLTGSTTTMAIGSTFGTTVTCNGTWNHTGAITTTSTLTAGSGVTGGIAGGTF
jgi:hypothetical protein